MSHLSVEHWLEAVISASHELAETTFEANAGGYEARTSIPRNIEGSILPVQLAGDSVQLGLLSTHEGCLALTRALLQMEEDEEPSDDDIPDAIGEIVNILAGIVQRAVDGAGLGAVTLGFPLFIRGDIFPPPRAETVVASLELGPARAELLVIRGELHDAARV